MLMPRMNNRFKAKNRNLWNRVQIDRIKTERSSR